MTLNDKIKNKKIYVSTNAWRMRRARSETAVVKDMRNTQGAAATAMAMAENIFAV